MLEDVQLRCKLAADILDEATQLAPHLLSALATPAQRSEFERVQHDVEVFRRISRSYALHLRETNVAQLLRQDLTAGRPMTVALADEFRQLLEADVLNQSGRGRVLEMRRLYRENPEAFIRRYLIPIEGAPAEKGDFTLTTR
jgi:hypothetical protein